MPEAPPAHFVARRRRYDARSGDIYGDSYLEDIFDDHSNDDGEMSGEQFEAACREWGYTRGEVHFHFRRLFENAATPPSPGSGSTLHTPQHRKKSAHSNAASPHGAGPVSAFSERHVAITEPAPTGSGDEAGPQGQGTPGGPPGSRGASRGEANSRRASLASNAGPDSDAGGYGMDGVEPASPGASSVMTAGSMRRASMADGLSPITPLPPSLVIDFSTFVALFMREPAPELRFREVPAQQLALVANMSKAAKAFKGALSKSTVGTASNKK